MTPQFRFVSLGSDCQAAAQITRLFPSRLSFPFDWVTSQIRHLHPLIENDFAGFLRPENLFPVYFEQSFQAVVDTRHRIGFNHDFASFDQEAILEIQERYRMRIRWFRGLFDPSRPPPYFIRRWHPRDGADDEGLALSLFEMLRGRRPDARFLYLHADPQRAPVFADGYRSAYLPQADPFVWYGCNETWQAMLNDFAMRPFEGDVRAFPLPGPIVRRVPRFA